MKHTLDQAIFTRFKNKRKEAILIRITCFLNSGRKKQKIHSETFPFLLIRYFPRIKKYGRHQNDKIFPIFSAFSLDPYLRFFQFIRSIISPWTVIVKIIAFSRNFILETSILWVATRSASINKMNTSPD